MQFAKRVLARLNMPYPLGFVTVGGETCVIASTEDRGPVVLASPPFERAEEILPGPGGSMALVEDPETPGELYAIMGCFPGYRFQTGSIHRLRGEAVGREGGWVSSKILDLPFAHRIGFVDRAGTRSLLAASLAADKSDPADWSRPGSVYACAVPRHDGERWQLVPILEGIHRNHGFLVTRFKGKRSVLVAGAEGMFMTDLDQPGDSWVFTRVLREEISEIAVFDIDGDGQDELITIEPFHGNRLCVYAPAPGRWRKAWEGELDFGHCLLAGNLDGAPAILVSNRAGGRDLLLFRFARGLSQPTRVVVDPGAGAANMLILSRAGGDLVFSTNQSAGEIAVYQAAP